MTTGARITHAVATLAGLGAAEQAHHGPIAGVVTAAGIYLSVAGAAWLWSRPPIVRLIRSWSAVAFAGATVAIGVIIWLFSEEATLLRNDSTVLQVAGAILNFLGVVGVPTIAWHWFRRPRRGPQAGRG